MRTHRQQADRGRILAQANLVAVMLCGGSTAEQLQEYVRSGHLGDSPAGASEQYDGAAMKAAVIAAKGQLGRIRQE